LHDATASYQETLKEERVLSIADQAIQAITTFHNLLCRNIAALMARCALLLWPSTGNSSRIVQCRHQAGKGSYEVSMVENT
jgi:hypothetical protein